MKYWSSLSTHELIKTKNNKEIATKQIKSIAVFHQLGLQTNIFNVSLKEIAK